MMKHELNWTGERFLPSIGDRMPEVYLEHLNRYFMARSFCTNKSVLDIASGEGYGSYLLSRLASEVIGIDVDAQAVAYAAGKYVADNLQYLCSSALNLPFESKKFDRVICFEMIEHIEAQMELVEEASRVLSDNGLFIVSTPNQYVHTEEFHSENQFHVKELAFNDFKQLLKSQFRYCYFFGQRVYQTAKAWPINAKSKISSNQVFIKRFQDYQVEIESNELAPAFYVCICSNQPVDNLEELYEVADASNMAKKLYEGEIHRLSSRVRQNFSKVYFDTGAGYSEQQVLTFPFEHDDDFSFIKFKFSIPMDAKYMRVDPVDESACIIGRMAVLTDSLSLNPILCNKLIQMQTSETLDVFTSNDSQYIYDVEQHRGRDIIISFTALLQYSVDTVQLIYALHAEMEQLKNEVNNRQNVVDTTAYQLQTARQEQLSQKERLEQCTQEKIILTNQLSEKEKTLANLLERQNDQFAAKEVLEQKLNKLQEAFFRSEQQRNETDKQFAHLREEKDSYINYVNNRLEVILNSTSWKITKPMRLIMDSLRCGIQLSIKGVTSLRKNGFIKTWRLVKTYKKRKEDEQQVLNLLTGENNVANLIPYESEYQTNIDFSAYSSNVKALAFYLPQFHTFKENDEWWGAGFTEWRNTTKADSRFAGHYQPRTPHKDIGYYDLSDIETLRKQVNLAKQHGIYGFCFYYYWFSGKRLMEKPVDMLLQHPEIDLPFCLCWANENWTRAWDGQNREILIAQEYSEKDTSAFIDDLIPYLSDTRYIRVEGKPVVVVYNPGQIPDCKKTFAHWRKRAEMQGVGEILIWTCQTANNTAESLSIVSSVDAEIEFPPHNMWHEFLGVKGLDVANKEAYIYNYQSLVEYLKANANTQDVPRLQAPIYRTCMMGWDNAARRANGWTTFYAYSLKSFYNWMRMIVQDAKKRFLESERFIFVNAWNEWAEGTYLEPDEKYGYSNINTFSKALFEKPFANELQIIDESTVPFPFSDNKETSRIALQIHLFYTDSLNEIIHQINQIPYRFDCYISTDSAEKKEKIELVFLQKCKAEKVCVELFDNRGRDVAPMLLQMKNRIESYDYFCHIHAKKTCTAEYGQEWRDYLFRHLFGTAEYVRCVLGLFEDHKDLGIVFPETFPVLLLQAEWGGNKDGCNSLLNKLGVECTLPNEPVFPVGNMFWARSNAIQHVFLHNWSSDDFPVEDGQVNATIAHQIERIWIYLCQSNKYDYLKTYNACTNEICMSAPKNNRIAFYVFYDVNDTVQDTDIKYIQELRKVTQTLIFISNSQLLQQELEKIDNLCDRIIVRKNIGFDFGAWKDALLEYGFDELAKFDQLILANNSCIGPIYGFSQLFAKMSAKSKVDYWGITLFPECKGSYLRVETIPEHVQSYFMVFKKSAFLSEAFLSFWKNMQYYSTLTEVILHGETHLSEVLKQAGLKQGVLIKESKYYCKYLNNYSVPYSFPYEMFIMGSPFIKKKSLSNISLEEQAKVNIFLSRIKFDI